MYQIKNIIYNKINELVKKVKKRAFTYCQNLFFTCEGINSKTRPPLTTDKTSRTSPRVAGPEVLSVRGRFWQYDLKSAIFSSEIGGSFDTIFLRRLGPIFEVTPAVTDLKSHQPTRQPAFQPAVASFLALYTLFHPRPFLQLLRAPQGLLVYTSSQTERTSSVGVYVSPG